MKIAVCYSGRPRYFYEGLENHRKFLGIDNDSVDVFAHIWFDDSLTGTPFRTDANQGIWPEGKIMDEMTKEWNPKEIVFASPKNFEDKFADKWDPKYHACHPKDNQLSQFYGIEESIKLKREYEDKHNFKYDYVVRMRTDTIFINSLGKISDYDKNKLHVFEVVPGPDWIGTGIADFATLDIFAFGGSEVMDKYGTVYSNIERAIDEGCPCYTPDSLLGYNAVKINNLQLQRHRWCFKIHTYALVYGDENYYAD